MAEPTMQTSEERGLQCPKCGGDDLHVVYTRRGAGGALIRRRECRACGRRFTTREARVGG